MDAGDPAPVNDALRRGLLLAGRYGLLLVPLVFLLVFFAYPLAAILGLSFWSGGVLDLSSFVEVATTRYYVDTAWFTLWQAAVSTLLTLLMALPAAYVFTRYRFPGRSLLLSLSTLPFVLPTVVVAAAFSALLGESGIVNEGLQSLFGLPNAPVQLERTLAIILIVHVFYNYAIALRMITGYWANQSLKIEEAARSLGAHGWRLWWHIRWPVVRPAVLSAGVLVFIFTFTSFGVILILGGPQYATLEVEIYTQAVNLFDLPVAAALSIVQIGVMFLMMIAYTRLQRRTAVDWQQARQVARTPRTARDRILVAVNLLVMCVLLFTPLIALVARSLRGSGGWTTANYTRLGENTRQSALFVPPLETVTNSLEFAIATTLLAVTLGLLAAYLLAQPRSRLTRFLDPVFMLPLATSAVTLGFGFTVALDEPPLNLANSWLMIPIAHTLVAMPFVVRSVLPALRGIPATLRESAAMLGASPWQVWRSVELPLISRGLAVGATFAFTISMGEFGASLFIARADAPTMPVAIFRLLGQPGAANYGQAMAMSVLLVLVCSAGFVLIERTRTVGIGEL